MSYRHWFPGSLDWDTELIKFMSIWTPPMHRQKGIAYRCMKTCLRYLDRVNENHLERDRGVMILFPVPFECGWSEHTRFDGTNDMLCYRDESGHCGYFPEYLHYRTWTELRDWYLELGFKETNHKALTVGMSARSKNIGRLPMVYPPLE